MDVFAWNVGQHGLYHAYADSFWLKRARRLKSGQYPAEMPHLHRRLPAHTRPVQILTNAMCFNKYINTTYAMNDTSVYLFNR
jgi:hypothetical protein